MATSADNFQFLDELHEKLTDEPLPPGDPLYEPIHYGSDDPVSLMQTYIRFNHVQSIQLFSGFRGSGKTTELFRLKKQLEDSGYYVLYADALEYLSPSEPIELTDFMLVLAGAFSDALDREGKGKISHESFWTKFKNFLDTDVSLKEIGLKGEAGTPGSEVIGGLKAGIDLKFELKRVSTFRQNLQRFLASRLRDLKNQVDQFFEDGFKLIRAEYGPTTRVVFIFDQLEQIRGIVQNEQDVFRSLERLFASDFDMIKLPYVHAVYTIPPWLKFLLPAGPRITVLPTPHLWHNDPGRSRSEDCWGMFRSLVRRRLGDEGLARLFGSDPAIAQQLVDRLIEMSGGPFRDLLRLLRETVLRASALPSLPVSAGVVDGVINNARNGFLPIAIEDAKWLAEIAHIRSTALQSAEPGPVNRLARFLDSHFVLYFTNANEWYDVHPLIRDEVAAVVRASSGSSAGRPNP